MLATLTLPSKASFPFQQSRRPKISVRAAVAEMVPPSAAAVDRKSLYEVLRVKRNASQVEIKTAYRTLAKLYHPDATSRFMDSSIAAAPSSPASRDFIEIHNAYATLSDPDARSVYDLNLNVESRRRWSSDGISSRFQSSPDRERFYRTRRWETDQCW